MARLEDLYKNFGTSTPEEQLHFLVEYRQRRAEDLEKPSTYNRKKPASKPKASPIVLTKEEELVMKMLGLTKKDMVSLRRSVEVSDTEESSELELLLEDMFSD